jgi:hypothetical protein
VRNGAAMTVLGHQEPTISADSITARYLLEVDRPILPLPDSPLTASRFGGRYLSRPLFFEAEELSGLERDLSLVWSALSTIPERLFDGSLAAFAKAVGMTEFQAECATRSQGSAARALTGMARADLYRDAAGYRLLEWNFGSPVGGVECAELCRRLRTDPGMAAFLDKEGLVYPDSVEAMLATVRSETGYPTGTRPVVALVDTPDALRRVASLLHGQAARWSDSGFSTMVGHLGELTRSDGRLLLRGEPVDVVYRLFTMDDALIHADDGLMEPLLLAAERDEVVIFTPLDAEMYGSKGALALLSEPVNQIGLTPEQRAACARLLPWTRRVQAGETSLEDGNGIDLLAYVADHQDDLVLKPSLSYAGNGVVVGADPAVAPAMWRDHLAQAVDDGSYVVQRLVRPVTELFPTEIPGDPAAWTVAWGVFMMRQGYAGTLVRAVPAEAGDGVVNYATGALVGCAFHAQA